MLQIYFYVLIALTAAMLLPVLWAPNKVYEYPQFMAIAFAVFILPQAYALYLDAWGGMYLEATLLTGILCLGCCWLGYHRHAHPGLLRRLDVQVEPRRFLLGGIALVTVAWFFSGLFDALPEEMISSNLTGIGTIYLFFASLVYPGFAVCFYCALKQRSGVAWLASAIAAVVPLQSVVLAGRREHAALFLITLGMCLYFIKGIKPPRILTVALVIGGAFMIPATSQYRSLAKEDPLDAFQQIDFGETFEKSLNEESVYELKNATALIAATQVTGDYELGAGYWNAIVFRFVPAQFVGKRLKDSLMVGGGQRSFSDFIESVLGGSIVTGTTPTGLGDSYSQFGYLGCVFFIALGYLFKTLWAAANRSGAAVAQILYIQSVTAAMRTVTHQTLDFPPAFIYSVVFIGLIAWFAKEPYSVGRSSASGALPRGLPGSHFQ